ncbi:3-deoxy-manno-octulosonate cytidylyltransferase [Oscillatoria sp. CS-180]|uniref:3-deoxy-manno-octulosonate cytidylyltransferase n=1 Tax=Oscillatoria sp. CS-180 TaxID=3021720 RepID=UPI00232CA351|nr:3-deoxy-manno-octulosonate cytidylyltransferase [Oscillatoria sp. CS-180]MDB9525406.1 3-deoxy-manno-octulosonate cytidylyltransferase [Oscillatoria sp. CS-180]
MKIIAIIPARYDSQRLPGKPLAKLGDRPLIQWVYQAAYQCAIFDNVIVATDSNLVADCVRQFGGHVELTHADHLSGTDRIAEVAARYPEYQVVVNIQGDQPFITETVLNQLIHPYLEGESPEMTTLACPLDKTVDYTNPNTVKVICDLTQHALYFSRAPIPYFRHNLEAPVYHHLGLYAFRYDFLVTYAQLPSTPIEQCESLEQLRVLEHGYRIRVCQTTKAILEINTPEDLMAANVSLTNCASS